MNLARIEDITNGLPVFMPSGIQARLFLEGDNIEVEYPELYRDSYTKEDFQKLIDEGIMVFHDIPKPYQSALMENLVKKGYIRESLGKEIDQPLEEAFNQEDNKPGDVYTALKDKEENGLEYVTPEFKNELLTCLTKICKEYPIVKVRQQALTFIDELGLQEYYDIKAVKDFINKYTDLLNAHVCESIDECDKKLTDKLGKALDKIVMAQRLGDLKKEQQAKNEYQELKKKLEKDESLNEELQYGVEYRNMHDGIHRLLVTDSKEKAEEILMFLNKLENPDTNDLDDNQIEDDAFVTWHLINSLANDCIEVDYREIEEGDGNYNGIYVINYNDIKPDIYESLNEEQGPYYGSEALGQIASEIETGAKQGFEPTEFGNWLLNTSWDMKWEQLTNEMALFVCEKIAMAVADGHVSYDDLELVFHEGCGLTKEDLLSAQVFDEEQIANILGEGEDIARISFELQFDGNLEVGESFKQKDKKKKKQKIEDSLNETVDVYDLKSVLGDYECSYVTDLTKDGELFTAWFIHEKDEKGLTGKQIKDADVYYMIANKIERKFGEKAQVITRQYKYAPEQIECLLLLPITGSKEYDNLKPGDKFTMEGYDGVCEVVEKTDEGNWECKAPTVGDGFTYFDLYVEDMDKVKLIQDESLTEEEGAGVYVKDKEGKISGPYTNNEAAKDYIKQMVEQGCKEEDFEITTDNGEEEMQETILVQEAFKVYNTAYGEVKEQGTFANWNEVQDYLDQEWGKYNVDMVKENPTFGTQLDKENFMNNYDVEIIEVPVTIEKNVIKLVEPEQAEVEGASSNKGEKSMLPQDEKPEIEQPEIEVCPKCGKNPCECNPNKPECPECEEEPCNCEDECCPECGCEPCECEKDEKIEEDFGDEHIGEIEGEDEYKEVSGVTVDTDEVNPEEVINGEIQFTPAEAETIGNMEPGEKILLPNEQPELDAGYSTGATEIIVTDIDDKTPEEEQLPIEDAEPEEIVGDIENYIKTLLDDEDEEVEIEVVEVPECMEGPKSPEDVKKEKEEEEEKNEDFQDNMGMLTDVKDLDMPDALADTIDTKEDGSLYKIGDLAKELEELKSMFKSEIENIKNDIKSALQDVKQDIKMDVNNVENKVNDTKTAVDDLTVEEEEPVEEAPAEEEEIENEEPIEAEEEIEESMGEVNPIAEAIEKTLKTKMSKTTFYNKLNENYGYNCLSESNISLKMMVDGYVEANKLNKYIIDESLEQEQADEAKYLKNKYLRKGKLENLEDAKKKIDQYTSQNKSSEDIKNAITLLSDNDEEKEQATDYAVEKMKESLLQTSQTSKLLNLSAGSGIGYKK